MQGMPEVDTTFKNPFIPLTTKKVIFLIILIGLCVFFTSLFNPFVFDDISQIIQNPYVNTFNVPINFYGTVYYPGVPGLTFLHTQYKPLLFTMYTLLFALSHMNTFPYHLFQLSIHILNVILIYLIFSRFFKRSLALFLSVVFLVHPINSEAVIYIADLQDTLFLLFGLLSLLVLIQKQHTVLSFKRLSLVFILLLLSLLSKTTGILFICIIPVYCFLFSKRNIKNILFTCAAVSIFYIALLINASHNPIFTTFPSPIQRLSLQQRSLSFPLIIIYYFQKFLIPINFSTGQEWIVRQVDFTHFFLPFSIDILVFAFILFFGIYIHKKKKEYFKSYSFFTVWFIVGLLMAIQIIPLDLTVSDRWFYFPIIGLLGILGIIGDILTKTLFKKYDSSSFHLVGSSVIVLLAVLTLIRVSQWQTPLQLYLHDLHYAVTSPVLNNFVGNTLLQQGEPKQALPYLQKAVEQDPLGENIPSLASAYEQEKDISKANELYWQDIQLTNALPKILSYEGIARINLIDKKNFKEAKTIAAMGVKKYPLDTDLQAYLAMSEYLLDEKQQAQNTALQLYKDQPTQMNQQLYTDIMNNTFQLPKP